MVATVSALAWGQAAIDGGSAKAVAPVERRVEAVEGEVKDLKKAGQTQALKTVRIETILEGLAAKQGVPVPPPVPQ